MSERWSIRFENGKAPRSIELKRRDLSHKSTIVYGYDSASITFIPFLFLRLTISCKHHRKRSRLEEKLEREKHARVRAIKGAIQIYHAAIEWDSTCTFMRECNKSEADRPPVVQTAHQCRFMLCSLPEGIARLSFTHLKSKSSTPKASHAKVFFHVFHFYFSFCFALFHRILFSPSSSYLIIILFSSLFFVIESFSSSVIFP